jgi:type IV pilus assembly protein PilC
MVFMGITVVTVFLGWFVAPQFHAMFLSFKVPVPRITGLMIQLSKILPGLMVFVLVAIACAPALLGIARLRGAEGAVSDVLVLPLPLVGQIVRANLVAGWCNAVRLGVEAGMDLPASIALAGDACASPRLRADGRAMIEAIEAGKSIESVERGKVLPPMVAAAMWLGIGNHDLPATLRSLSEMYEQQAENRLSMLPTILTPLIVLLLACAIGLIILSVLLPVLALFRSVVGI